MSDFKKNCKKQRVKVTTKLKILTPRIDKKTALKIIKLYKDFNRYI
jgi:hypothetical protein